MMRFFWTFSSTNENAKLIELKIDCGYNTNFHYMDVNSSW